MSPRERDLVSAHWNTRQDSSLSLGELSRFPLHNFDSGSRLQAQRVYPNGPGTTPQETRFFFDENNRVTKTRDPEQRETEIRYWADQVATVKDPLGRTVGLHHDEVGRLTRVQLPNPISAGSSGEPYPYDICEDGPELRYEFDVSGDCTKTISPAGETIYAYTPQWHKPRYIAREVTPGVLAESRFEYDLLGSMTKSIDANGHATEFIYSDQIRKLIQKREQDDSGQLVTFYNYNCKGQLSFKKSPNGVDFLFEYDKKGNLTKKIYPEYEISYAFDRLGKKTSVSGPCCQIGYEHNALGQVTKEIHPISGTSSYSLDQVGRRTGMTWTEPGETSPSREFSYQFDMLNRLTAIEEIGGAGQTTFLFDEGGRLTKKSCANGPVTTYESDRLDRITELSNYRSEGGIGVQRLP